jgi:hypothetical protein
MCTENTIVHGRKYNKYTPEEKRRSLLGKNIEYKKAILADRSTF